MGRIIVAICMALHAAAISASTPNHVIAVHPSCSPSSDVKTVVSVYPYTTLQLVVTTTTVSIIYTRTYYHTIFLPSPPNTVADIQCTATVTQCDSDSISGVVAKQGNTAAGVVGGFIGGLVIGIVLTLVITTITGAILITKHHKKRERGGKSRYL